MIDQPLELQPAAATKTWVQSQGVAPQPRPYADAALARLAGSSIQVKNTGDVFGTKTVVSGGYSNGQVPLTLYNNWVRWIWVYVQYLGPGDANLSANPERVVPGHRSTASPSGSSPQVNTILGVPLGARTASTSRWTTRRARTRPALLFCGLGSDLSGGGWRQYFPADAYPGTDRAAGRGPGPRAAHRHPHHRPDRLLPGHGPQRRHRVHRHQGAHLGAGQGRGGASSTPSWRSGCPWGRRSRSMSRPATRTRRGQRPEHLQPPAAARERGSRRCSSPPSSAPAWGRIGAAVAGVEGGVGRAGGDPRHRRGARRHRRARRCRDAGRGVRRDDRGAVGDRERGQPHLPGRGDGVDATASQASTFPVTARSWTLEAKVDGAVDARPDHRLDQRRTAASASDPLVLSVTAPFGGQQIQWSIVFTGLRRATRSAPGCRPGAPNDDPSEPALGRLDHVPARSRPRSPPTTRFKRSDTAGYSTAAGGYTWSNQITDSGTLADKGIQEVAGASISTLAGVAGVVWEQDDRFYLRGVPVAENGNTITLGPATAERLRAARRSCCSIRSSSAGRPGNHVLLEPDPDTAGYHVRQVTLDADHRRADLGLRRSPRDLPAADLGRRAALVVAASWRSTPTAAASVRCCRPDPRRRRPLAAYTRRARHPGRVPQLARRPCGHQPRHRAGPRGRRAPDRRPSTSTATRSPTSPAPPPATRRALRLGARRPGHRAVHATRWPTARQLPGPGRRRRRADLRPLLHGRRLGAGRTTASMSTRPTGALLDNASPGVNVPHFAVDYWRSIYAANYDPLADTVYRPAAHRPRARRRGAVAQPLRSNRRRRRSRGCGAASGRGRADDAPRARRRATRPRVACLRRPPPSPDPPTCSGTTRSPARSAARPSTARASTRTSSPGSARVSHCRASGSTARTSSGPTA